MAFGEHYDPGNTSYGRLIAHNDETLEPGAGFEPHHHDGIEVVTWVVEGTLAHADSAGERGTVQEGTVQRMTAGRGLVHSERNGGGPGASLRFIQLWFDSPEYDGEPSYEQQAIDRADLSRGLVLIAGPSPAAAGVALMTPGAEVYVGSPPAGSVVMIPPAPFIHTFVVAGVVELTTGMIVRTGDAARFTTRDAVRAQVNADAELIVCVMQER
jgi:quercetin 2,3-dioxygenase